MVTVSPLQVQRLQQSGSGFTGVTAIVFCRRIQRGLSVGQIREKLFSPSNQSCNLCKEGSGGHFPCQAK